MAVSNLTNPSLPKLLVTSSVEAKRPCAPGQAEGAAILLVKPTSRPTDTWTKNLCADVSYIHNRSGASAQTYVHTPAHTLDTHITRKPAHTLDTHITHTPAHTLDTDITHTPAHTLDTHITHTPAYTLDTHITHKPAHTLDTHITHKPAHTLDTHITHTPEHALDSHITHTPAHTLDTHVTHTPAHTLDTHITHTRISEPRGKCSSSSCRPLFKCWTKQIGCQAMPRHGCLNTRPSLVTRRHALSTSSNFLLFPFRIGAEELHFPRKRKDAAATRTSALNAQSVSFLFREAIECVGHTHTHAHSHRDTDTATQTQRHTDTEAHMHTDTHTQTHTHTDTHTQCNS